MAFRLTLKPRERAVLSGAVIRNGHSRAVLLVENEVPILRESDILSPRAVRTPADCVVMAIQLMYLDPAQRETHTTSYRTFVEELHAAAPSLRADLAQIDAHVGAGRFYQALKAGRQLREDERRILDRVR